VRTLHVMNPNMISRILRALKLV